MNRYLKLNEGTLNIPENEVESLLKTENVEISHFNGFFDFHIQDKDGNQLRNDPYGLILFLDNIREQLSEEKEEKVILHKDEDEDFCSEEQISAKNKLGKLSKDEITSHFHYDLICESPLEMTLQCQKNSIATGMFAITILGYIKRQLEQEFVEDEVKRKNRRMTR